MASVCTESARIVVPKEKGIVRENSPLGVDISALNLDFIKGFSQKVKMDRYGKSRKVAKLHSIPETTYPEVEVA